MNRQGRNIVASTLAVLALAAVLWSPVAYLRAGTVSECHALIDVVRTTLAGTDIGGGNSDRTRASLNSKLDGADLKLDQYKACDAFDKLVQFRDQVNALATSNAKGETKIDPAAAAQLAAEAQDAIDCVLQLDPTCDDF